MLWIVLALLASVLFASSNFLDKYALGSYFEKFSVKSYVAATGIIGIPFLAFVAGFAYQDIVGIDDWRKLLAFCAGLAFSLGIAVYLKALSKADTSLVVSLFHMIIILDLVFGYLFLDERLGLGSLLLILIFIGGAVMLAVEQDEQGFKFRKDIFMIMVVSCGLIATSDVLFKVSAVDGGSYASSQFFEYLASVCLGVLIFLSSKRVRADFRSLFKSGAVVVLNLLLINELLALGGMIMMRMASLHLPLAVLQALLGIQSVLLVFMGVVLTKLWPDKIHENIGRRNLIGKLIAIGIMMAAEIGLILTTV